MSFKLEQTINKKTFRISFSYPDKYMENERKYTIARLYEKLINEENKEDFIWVEKGKAQSSCNLDYDYFSKYWGKYWAFKYLIDENFTRNDRKIWWETFFKIFGKPYRINRAEFILPVES